MDTGAILIGLAILLLSVLLVLEPFRKNSKEMQVVSAAEREHPDARRRKILSVLRDLEFDYKLGKIIQEDHAAMRSQLLLEAASLIAESEAADQEIEALIERRRQTQQKSEEFCPNCKNVLSEADRYCPSCGTALSRDCPDCGADTLPGALFCSHCGARLGRDTKE